MFVFLLFYKKYGSQMKFQRNRYLGHVKVCGRKKFEKQCVVCHEEFQSLDQLKVHYSYCGYCPTHNYHIVEHNYIDYLKCLSNISRYFCAKGIYKEKVCKLCRSSIVMSEFANHKKSCKLKSSKIVCKKCKKLFKSKVRLKVHSQTCKGRLECPKCLKVYTSMFWLKKHVGKCDGKSIPCIVCGGRFASNVIAAHLEKCRPRCKKCGYYNLKESIQHHKDHNIACLGKFCSGCENWYGISTVHKCSDDELIAKFVCKYCNRRYKSEKSLNDHLKNVHKSINKVYCSRCNAEFESSYNLRLHNCVEDIVVSKKLQYLHFLQKM